MRLIEIELVDFVLNLVALLLVIFRLLLLDIESVVLGFIHARTKCLGARIAHLCYLHLVYWLLLSCFLQSHKEGR